MLEGDVKEYLAINTVTDANSTNLLKEFLNSLNLTEFPPYKLKLKIGTPMLL